MYVGGPGRGRGMPGRGYRQDFGAGYEGAMGPGRGGQGYPEPYGRGGGYAAAAAYGMGPPEGPSHGHMINGDPYMNRGPGGPFPVVSPSGWTQYLTDDGEAYYHNHATGQTQWEKPPDWTG